MSALLFVVLALPVYSQEKIRIVTEDYPPLNYLKDGLLTGPAVDIVNAIQEKANTNTVIQVLPWRRAYISAEKMNNTAVFSLTRSNDREALFKWVGPIAVKRYGFYALSDSSIKIDAIEDALKYVVGVQNGGISEEFLRAEGFKTIHAVTSPNQNLGKLLRRRIDLWYASNGTIDEQIRRMVIKPEKIHEVFSVRDEKLYVGFNKNTDDSIVSKWQGLYQELHNSGVIKKIYSNHSLDIHYPTMITD